jgi:hypothetical protein
MSLILTISRSRNVCEQGLLGLKLKIGFSDRRQAARETLRGEGSCLRIVTSVQKTDGFAAASDEGTCGDATTPFHP